MEIPVQAEVLSLMVRKHFPVREAGNNKKI